jgi:hypothetical protein
MGYVEETGAAQYYRDARITSIYEGTTGIQAADLVGRKILRDGGAALQALIADIQATDTELARHDALAGIRAGLQDGCESLAAAAQWLGANHARDPGVPGGVSYHMLMLMGTVVGGWQLARAAAIAQARLADSPADSAFYQAKITTARFYAGQIMPGALAHRRAIEAGCDALLGLPEEQF